jgi:hypothetical protein
MDCHVNSHLDNDETRTSYGPFPDEEFFFYYDKSTIPLEGLEIYHKTNGFIGFDDLEVIYDKGKDASFDDVFFSGIVTISNASTSRSPFRFSLMIVLISYLKVDCLCQSVHEPIEGGSK